MNNPTLLKIEVRAMRDREFQALAMLLTSAISAMPAKPDRVYLEECRAIDLALTRRGQYLASLN